MRMAVALGSPLEPIRDRGTARSARRSMQVQPQTTSTTSVDLDRMPQCCFPGLAVHPYRRNFVNQCRGCGRSSHSSCAEVAVGRRAVTLLERSEMEPHDNVSSQAGSRSQGRQPNRAEAEGFMFTKIHERTFRKFLKLFRENSNTIELRTEPSKRSSDKPFVSIRCLQKQETIEK